MMQRILIINTVVCVLGIMGGVLAALGSLISIANMKVPWTSALIVAAFGMPVMFLVSGLGAWLASGRGASSLAIALVALPWVYGALFVGAMLLSFKQ